MKCVADPTSIVPLESVALKDSFRYEHVAVEILDCQVKRFKNKEVASVKILWRSQSIEGTTWEGEQLWKSSILTSFLQIPLQLEVIVPFKFPVIHA